MTARRGREILMTGSCLSGSRNADNDDCGGGGDSRAGMADNDEPTESDDDDEAIAFWQSREDRRIGHDSLKLYDKISNKNNKQQPVTGTCVHTCRHMIQIDGW